MKKISTYELKQRWQQNRINPIYLFAGPEKYLIQQAVNQLTGILFPTGQDRSFDLQTFYGDDINVLDLITHLNTVPFVNSQRLVILKTAQKLSTENIKLILPYMEHPSPTSCLVLVLDKHDRPASLIQSALKSDTCVVTFFWEMETEDLNEWIIQQFKKNRKSIDRDTVGLLVNETGISSTELEQEIEKICTYVGTKQVVETEDIENITRGYSIQLFNDLVTAIALSQETQAINTLERMYRLGENPVKIINSLVFWQHNLLVAKSLRHSGTSDRDITLQLRIHFRVANQFLTQLNLISVPKLKSLFHYCIQTDWECKRGKTEPYLALERLIYNYVTPIITN